jgi:hypothetical protein
MQRKIRRFVPSLRPSSEERTGERSWDVCLAQGWPSIVILAVDADGEPAGASGENRLALCQGCSGAVNTIPWTDERVSLDALADECRELLGFGLGEVKVIGDPSLRAGDADSRTGQFLPPKVGTASTSAATELLFVSFAIPAVAQPHAARPIAETSNPDLPSARVIMVLSSIQGCPVIRPVESET